MLSSFTFQVLIAITALSLTSLALLRARSLRVAKLLQSSSALRSASLLRGSTR